MEILERVEEYCLASKLRDCDGTVFWFVPWKNREQAAWFQRTSRAAGRRPQHCGSIHTVIPPEKLAEQFAQNALFVAPPLQEYQERYLNACPPEVRHLLIYSWPEERAFPDSGVFLDFWRERGVEIWESGSPWWLLDVETSGTDREKASIIALRLARLENLDTAEERTILVRPDAPLSPWAEGLTGISNRDLEQAVSLKDALAQLEVIRDRFLFLDRGFTRPFLEHAYQSCGKKYSLGTMPLDQLLKQAGVNPGQRTKKLLEAVPVPPDVESRVSPKDRDLAELHRLTLALFYQ